MKHPYLRVITTFCCCVLLSAPLAYSADDSKSDSTAQSGVPSDSADKGKEGKPADSGEAKKKGASDDEPGCNN